MALRNYRGYAFLDETKVQMYAEMVMRQYKVPNQKFPVYNVTRKRVRVRQC